MKMLDLFSGIGGFSLAASWTGGIETVAFCEIEPFCQKVLKKHWPDVPIHDDIRTLRGREDVGTVDIVCGGFPCQPFSYAGKRRGAEDDRYLWPEMFRIIQECKPSWVVGENVVGLIDLALEQCFIDLETEGYEVQPLIIPACGVGAPHRRDRVWIIAYSSSKATNKSMGISKIPIIQQRCQKFGSEGWEQFKLVTEQVAPSKWWTRGLPNPRPLLIRDDDGIPDRVDRLKALGNAIVPQVVYPIFQTIIDIENQIKT
jgi:DNA (cytosine-5)-methyltransferase 1